MPDPAPTRTYAVARRLALAVLLLGGAAAMLLLVYPHGMTINRLNVRIWFAATSPFGLQDDISPDRFADVMNVLLFLPIAAALAVLVPTWWWVLAGFLGSCAVEAYQFVIGTRVASPVDIAMNTIGAALGTAIGIAVVRWCGGPPGARRRAPARSTQE